MFQGSAKTVVKSLTDKKIIYEVTVLANISFPKERGILHYCWPKDCCRKGKKNNRENKKKNPNLP